MDNTDSEGRHKLTRMKTFLTIAGAILMMILICFGAFLFSISRGPVKREISGPRTLSQDWAEILLNPPLTHSPGQWCSMTFYVADSVSPDYESKGLRLDDGSIVIPEVQLVDVNGNAHNLVQNAVGPTSITFGFPSLPGTSEYKAVRMRSYKDLRCSRIVCLCRYMK